MNFIPKDRCHFLQIEDGVSTPLVELKGKGKWGTGRRGYKPFTLIDSGEREIFETSSSNPLILIMGMSVLPVIHSLFSAKADYSSRKGGTQFIF